MEQTNKEHEHAISTIVEEFNILKHELKES